MHCNSCTEKNWAAECIRASSEAAQSRVREKRPLREAIDQQKIPDSSIHSVILPFILHSFTGSWDRFIASLICSVIDALTHLFTDSLDWTESWLIRWVIDFMDSIYSFTYRLIDGLMHWIVHSFVHWFTDSLIHWLTDQLTWFIDSLVHSFIYSLGQSSIHWFIGSFRQLGMQSSPGLPIFILGFQLPFIVGWFWSPFFLDHQSLWMIGCDEVMMSHLAQDWIIVAHLSSVSQTGGYW